jgi:tRNA-binding protein
MRVGTILEVKNFPEAKNPSYQVWIDFGDFGIKKTSAQVPKYKKSELLGKQVIAIVNFFPKQIANFMSECLILAVVDDYKKVLALLQTEKRVKNGMRIL